MTRTMKKAAMKSAGLAAVCAIALGSALASACADNARTALSAEQRDKARTACIEDFRKFCATTKRGEGRVWHCLKSRESELSAACRAVIAEAGPAAAR